MTPQEQRAAAKQFAERWNGHGYEKGETHRFWIDLCENVLGIADAVHKIAFEKQVTVGGQTKFIDGYIGETRVLIEQKGAHIKLDKPERQSDGAMLTPYEQAERYAKDLVGDENPLWIVVCNFHTFEIHNRQDKRSEVVVVHLDELDKRFPQFDFLFRQDVKKISAEMELSIKAGDIVGVLYDKLYKQYRNPDEQSLKSLNALCVRLVFCLYAEDAGLFGRRTLFHDYLAPIPAEGLRKALVDLFRTLDAHEDSRDKYLADDNPALAAFPYVNGGLFADETIEIPPFTDEIKEFLLKNGSEDFNWSQISPTIFGAVFESTLNPATRRSGGMHYTSIENIHKVIDPLFMNELQAEFNTIAELKNVKQRTERLRAFQARLAELTFLDPACGSGNFLTETYLSLRRLENSCLRLIYGTDAKGAMIGFDDDDVIRVSIQQFYGIEINDFAVTVAKTALWIAESQMMDETKSIVDKNFDFLPLRSYANIVEGNALRMDWHTLQTTVEQDLFSIQLPKTANDENASCRGVGGLLRPHCAGPKRTESHCGIS